MADHDFAPDETTLETPTLKRKARRISGLGRLEAKGFRIVSWLAAVATILAFLVVVAVQIRGEDGGPFMCLANEQTSPTQAVSVPDQEVGQSSVSAAETFPEALVVQSGIPELSSNICVNKQAAQPGDELSYSIHVANEGNAALSYDYLIFMTLDSRLSYVVGSSELVRNSDNM